MKIGKKMYICIWIIIHFLLKSDDACDGFYPKRNLGSRKDKIRQTEFCM